MPFKFEKLRIWKESVSFSSAIYSLTKRLPKSEEFGLVSQLNRAAVSMSINIAEGQGRGSDAEFSRFIQISIGSLNEVVTLLFICLEQKYIAQASFDSYYKECEKLSKMLFSFRSFLKTDHKSISHRP